MGVPGRMFSRTALVDLLHDIGDARSSFDAEPADTRDIGAIDMDPFAHRNEVYRTSAPLCNRQSLAVVGTFELLKEIGLSAIRGERMP